MRRRALCISLLIGLSATRALAAPAKPARDCAKAPDRVVSDLTAPGRSLAGLPTIEQIGGTCYAAAASTALTAALRKPPYAALSERCSTLEVACAFEARDYRADPRKYEITRSGVSPKQYRPARFLEGSARRLCDAIETARERGGCCSHDATNDPIEGKVLARVQSVGKPIFDVYRGLPALAQTDAEQTSFLNRAPYRERLAQASRLLVDLLRFGRSARCESSAHRSTVDELGAALRDLNDQTGLLFPPVAIDRYYQKECPDAAGAVWQRDRARTQALKCDRPPDLDSLPAFVGERLATGNPVYISFCSAILFAGSAPEAHATVRGVLADEQPCGRHAALIVGERCRNGKREYRLRNSWGAQCLSHLDSFAPCADDETGDHWVPEGILLPVAAAAESVV